MKLIVLISTLLLAASLTDAQVVVIDPTAIARNQANQVVNVAEYVQMINNQFQQNQAYVKAFGDPEQLLNIVGADELISSLRQTGVGLHATIIVTIVVTRVAQACVEQKR